MKTFTDCENVLFMCVWYTLSSPKPALKKRRSQYIVSCPVYQHFKQSEKSIEDYFQITIIQVSLIL